MLKQEVKEADFTQAGHVEHAALKGVHLHPLGKGCRCTPFQRYLHPPTSTMSWQWPSCLSVVAHSQSHDKHMITA